MSQSCDRTSQAIPWSAQYFVIASTKIRLPPGIAALVASLAEISCCIERGCGKLIANSGAELARIEPFTRKARHASGSLQDRVREG
jgi:hypothetical protein